MIKIICLKWGNKYQSHYVNKLFHGIKRNTTLDFDFHCFTENQNGIEAGIKAHPLPYNQISSWWNKLFLFSNEVPFEKGDILFYVDLDTLITRNVNNILKYEPKKITVLRDFYTGLARTVVGNDNIGSGLMSWIHGEYTFIWDEFIKDPNKAINQVKPHGDQRWIQHCIDERIYWQDVFPGEISSFKVHCNNGLPRKTKIVCYHGRPSIPESFSKRNRVWKYDILPQTWVKEHWREGE